MRVQWLPLLAALTVAACAQEPASPPAAAQVAAPGGCLPDGDGRLEASLHGALVGEIRWDDAQMQCEGGLRPDGTGMRVVVAGDMPRTGSDASGEARKLRFIIGLSLIDTVDGPAQVLPTNLTVMVEGESLLFATRGDDKCAVEGLRRAPLSPGVEKVSARGYCTGPAMAVAGDAPLMVPTFSFTALARIDDGAAPPPAP